MKKLSDAQIRFFNTFGYVAMPGALTPDEVQWITEGFEWSIQNQGQGKNHDGSKRTMFGAPIEHTDKMCTILDLPVVEGALASVIGDDFNYCSGDGNYYSGDTGWHPDGSWGEPWAVKLAFYLDPVTKDTGCLRVIPGSQDPNHFVRRNHLDLNKTQEQFGVLPRDFPGNVPLETKPGDLVMFNHDTWHSAWGGGHRRRMFTMNCTRNAKTEHDHKIAREYLKVHSAGAGNFSTGAGMYYPRMLDTAGPRRMVHLRQAAAIHDELFPHLARNKSQTPVEV